MKKGSEGAAACLIEVEMVYKLTAFVSISTGIICLGIWHFAGFHWDSYGHGPAWLFFTLSFLFLANSVGAYLIENDNKS